MRGLGQKQLRLGLRPGRNTGDKATTCVFALFYIHNRIADFGHFGGTVEAETGHRQKNHVRRGAALDYIVRRQQKVKILTG